MAGTEFCHLIAHYAVKSTNNITMHMLHVACESMFDFDSKILFISYKILFSPPCNNLAFNYENESFELLITKKVFYLMF